VLPSVNRATPWLAHKEIVLVLARTVQKTATRGQLFVGFFEAAYPGMTIEVKVSHGLPSVGGGMKARRPRKARVRKQHLVAPVVPALRPRAPEAASRSLASDNSDLEEWMEAESEVLEPEVHKWNELTIQTPTAGDEAGRSQPQRKRSRRGRIRGSSRAKMSEAPL